MALPFPRLTTPHFFVPVKCFAFSLSGAKKRQLPRTLCDIELSNLLFIHFLIEIISKVFILKYFMSIIEYFKFITFFTKSFSCIKLWIHCIEQKKEIW